MAQRQIHRPEGFEKDLKHLAKKHREMPKTLEKVINEIATTDTTVPGDRIPGLKDQPVYKVRVKMGDKGKLGGARLIYYCAEQLVIPLAVYAKNELENISLGAIRDALKAAGIVPTDESEA